MTGMTRPFTVNCQQPAEPVHTVHNAQLYAIRLPWYAYAQHNLIQLYNWSY